MGLILTCFTQNSGDECVGDDVITDVCDALIFILCTLTVMQTLGCYVLSLFCLIYMIDFCRWLNFEDPLINHNPWTPQEDKTLLLFVQEKGISNWIDIAASLRTNRTPFQCLARYQRSLNVSILKREWTKNEDAKLRSAVEAFGESDWQSVASVLEGWTGTQCSNRLVSFDILEVT